MEIVFFILKTAGVILLLILGLLLTAAALLLWVPVRYRAEGRLPEEGKPQAYVRFTWLLHLINVRVEYADGLKLTVRAAGIRIRPEQWKRREKAPESREPEKSVEGQGAGGGPFPENGKAQETGKPSETAEEKPSVLRIPESPPHEETVPNEERSDHSEKAVPPAEKGMSERIRKWAAALKEALRRLTESLKNVGQTLEQIGKKVEQIRETAVYYRDLFTNAESQETIRLVWKHVKGLLLHVRPKKLSAEFIVGASDPAVTGNVLAVHGILYPWIGEEVRIIPDFEKERLCGEFYAAGRIRACVVLYHVLRVILYKKTWTFIRQLKRRS